MYQVENAFGETCHSLHWPLASCLQTLGLEVFKRRNFRFVVFEPVACRAYQSEADVPSALLRPPCVQPGDAVVLNQPVLQIFLKITKEICRHPWWGLHIGGGRRWRFVLLRHEFIVCVHFFLGCSDSVPIFGSWPWLLRLPRVSGSSTGINFPVLEEDRCRQII